MFVFFACLFSLVLLFVAFKCHDQFDPARYFLLLWGGQIVLIYGVFHNQFIFTGYGLVYITMATAVFSMGTLAGQLAGNRVSKKTNAFQFNSKRALLFLQICLGFALWNVVQEIHANGFKLSEIFSFETLLEMNVAAATDRYTTNRAVNLSSQLTLIFIYMAPLYGGYLLPLFRGKMRIWCYLTILPTLLISITQAVKSGFITSIVLFVVGMLVSAHANNKEFFNISKTTVLKSTLLAGLFLTVLFVSMMLRSGTFDKESVEIVSTNFVTYGFGHLPAFDAWFTDNLGTIDPDGGLKTFYGISNYLGLEERKQGIFIEPIYFWKDMNHNIPSNLYTNIYTAFRFMLEDFGFIGSFLFMFVSGMLSGFAWLMVRIQRNTLVFQTVMVAILFYIFLSFLVSVWAYTSYMAAVAGFYVLLRFTFSKPTQTEFAA